MLVTIDQTDFRVSCKLHEGVYSWAGASSEGGYIGRDLGAFLSSINSGAAGIYAISELFGSLGVDTDLTVLYDMQVQISGRGAGHQGRQNLVHLILGLKRISIKGMVVLRFVIHKEKYLDHQSSCLILPA
eukprot:SAG11_NODE_781_length_7193_cov_25.713561_4_plen_130_part_00